MSETAFWAIVRKVQTLAADGSINVTLNLPENAIPEAAELMAYQINGVVLDVTCRPKEQNERDADQNGRQPTRPHY